MQFGYETFAFITFVRLCQSRYNILVSRAQERLWGVLVIKFKLARFEALTAVLPIPQLIWNIYCADCYQLLTFERIIVPSTSGSNISRLLDPVSIQCQKKTGCGHEDIEEALSTETSHRYTVRNPQA